MINEQQKVLKRLIRRTRFTQFLAWLALFFTMVGIAAGYKNWLRISDRAKTGLKGVEEIKNELPNFALKERLTLLEKELNDNFKNNKAHLDAAMHELRNIQDSTQHIAEAVYTQVEMLTKQQEAMVKIQTPTIKDWSLGEVHFLLQTALQRFNLQHDKRGASEAFKLADTLLVKRGSIEFLPVRKQISIDIAAVKQYANVDTSALSQIIDELLLQLKPLPIEETKAEATELILFGEKKDGKENTEETKKGSLVSRVKETISNAVVIRKEGKTLQEEMDSEAKERLYHLLLLRLETLRMMLLQGDNKNYHQQIKRLKIMTKSYYSQKTNTELLEKLDYLDSINLSPVLPDVSQSLILLEALMSESIDNKDN